MQLEDALTDNAKDITVARLVIRDLIADKLRTAETKTSRVLLFDGQTTACQFPSLREIIELENRVTRFGMVKIVKLINSLPSISAFTAASLHMVSTPKPTRMNISQQVILHLILQNVLSNGFPDKRPVTADDLVKTAQTAKRAAMHKAPVFSSIKLGTNGLPMFETPTNIAPVPAPVGPTPVPAPPVKLNLEPQPMDISDEESRSQSRSRSDSPSERYQSSSHTNYRRFRRSR